VSLEPAVHLSLDDPLLRGCQQGLALGQGQAQIVSPLGDLCQGCNLLCVANGAVISDDLKHDPDLHGTFRALSGEPDAFTSHWSAWLHHC
jgi:hypothetical protein